MVLWIVTLCDLNSRPALNISHLSSRETAVRATENMCVGSRQRAPNNLICQFNAPVDLPAPLLFKFPIFFPLKLLMEKIFFLQNMAINFWQLSSEFT